MTLREDIDSNDKDRRFARRPEPLRLTRRALTTGAAATACGAAAMAVSRLFTDGAAAAPTTDSSEPCPAQSAASPAAPATQVIIENFTFSPETLTVPVGTEVTWENRDGVPHTVTSDDKTTFASPLLDTGDRFSFTFNEAGTFAYFCSVHPMMTAKVIVQA
jgi:plastocyanin